MTEALQVVFDLSVLVIGISALLKVRALRREYEAHRDSSFMHHRHDPGRP